MKKIIALILAALVLCTALGALAEDGQPAPLYATVGEALDDSHEGRVISGGVPGDYYAVVTLKDGSYYRSVAYYDDTLNELTAAVDALDYEDEDFFKLHEAAMTAVDEYLKTLPIAYSERFTAQPLTDTEMEAVLGKTLDQLTEEGFEIGTHGTENGEGDDMLIVYTLRKDVYDYDCTVDADFDTYIDAQENGTDGKLVVTGINLAGITEWGFDKRFHTDGTVEQPKDPFAEFGEVMSAVLDLFEKVKAGEQVDVEAFAASLKDAHPDYADMIDMYITAYKTLGVDGLSSMLAPVQQ